MRASPRPTVRLTVAQAIVTYLAAQHSVADGNRRRLIPAALGIFGHGNVAGAVQAMREIDSGTIHVNWTPLWRADLMPYGGLKGSGVGKEGPRSAVEEMTEVKTVVLHGRPW